MVFSISNTVLRGAHPNTVLLRLSDGAGQTVEVNASSLGGGRIRVNAIDGMEATFTGDYPTLIIRNEDRPGQVAEVASLLSWRGVNIATMQLYRDKRGGLAVMVIESDQPIQQNMIEVLRTSPGMVRVTYLNPERGN
jgi:L-serine dehydratase